jgi:DNA mismatch endonuclease (patch repair protein)
MPKTNTDFWTVKIKRNQERDEEVLQKLKQMGWNTIVLWECQLKPFNREQTLRSLDYTLCKLLLADYSN